jgi:CDP-diacylglycerol--serine O-phosphatidyltransferase
MFNLANLFTAGNLLSGCFAILLALSGRADWAPIAIFAGMIFDFLDGFVARLTKTSGELGKQLDSLSDMVSFGVAPGLIMMVYLVQADFGAYHQQAIVNADNFAMWFDHALHGTTDNYLPFIAFIFPLCALFRLAKFNLDTRQTDSFIGLPTPAATLFFMSFPLAWLAPDHWCNQSAFAEVLSHPLLVAVCLVLVSVMMLSPLPMFSLKVKGFGWKGNEIRYPFLLISLGLILFFGAWSFALIVFLYSIISIIHSTFSKKQEV